jgi:ubiquinone/menaquinone biosynthesis C-methylase UbiE
MFGSVTQRLLRQTGLTEGMRVLDLGSGTGAVSLHAAEIVGSRGAVIGIDQSADAVAFANSCVRRMGLNHVAFHVSDLGDFDSSTPFDLAIGQFVLLYQPDPVFFIRTAARHVRPGGRIAFHEMAVDLDFHANPSFPAWETARKAVKTILDTSLSNHDVALRFAEHFHHAGLSRPEVFAEMYTTCDPDSPVFRWVAENTRTVLPVLVKTGKMSLEEVDIESLEERLRKEAAENHSQICIFPTICAWAAV